MGEFSHFDDQGNAVMVDITDKEESFRSAVASGWIYVNRRVMDGIIRRTLPKGDVLGVARVAGIMGVKQTANLIPMCHTLLLTKCSVEFRTDEEQCRIQARCTVKTQGKTGVEMEALTGVSTALLTVYDMCKAVDKDMRITDICLEEKLGGKSGRYRRRDAGEQEADRDAEMTL